MNIKLRRPKKGIVQSGFTLIEIMVVVVIIGLLATMVLPNIMGQQDKAAVIKAKADIRAISTAIKLYKLDNYKYPSSLAELASKGSGGGRGYLDKVPKDPWKKDYQYAASGSHFDFDLWTVTPQSAGSKQLGNWNLDEVQ